MKELNESVLFDIENNYCWAMELQKMFYEFDMAMMMEENTAGEPARGNV